MTLKVGFDGPSSRPPVTVMTAFRRTVEQHGDRLALAVKREKTQPWTTWTYKQYFEDVKKAAKAFIQ